MVHRFLSRSAWIALGSGLVSSPCLAIDYNEAVSGDFANSGLTPTSLGALTVGSNQMSGRTGSSDRDYFTFSVPSGFQLVSLTALPGTVAGGNFSFIGIQAGSQVTLPTNTVTATGLLGWTHYNAGDINTDILPRMSVASNGSSGFTPPLNAGNYALWIQDVTPGQFAYGFRFGVQPVPSPAAWSVFALGGLPVLRLLRRRHK